MKSCFILLLIFSHFAALAGIQLSSNSDGDLNAVVEDSANLGAITNVVTLSHWHTQANIADQGGGFFGRDDAAGGGKVQWMMKESGDRRADFIYTPSDNGATEHWRSTGLYRSTNVLKNITVVHTFGSGASVRLYSNAVSVAGSWIAGTGNKAGTNPPSVKLRVPIQAAGARSQGYHSESAVWHSALNFAQVELLTKSHVKGIALQISPSTLRGYFPLDSWPNGLNIPAGVIFPDRSGNGNQLKATTTGVIFSQGEAERVCSYQPNE